MKQSKYKVDNLYICECGRQFEKSQSLNAHFSHCKIHRECIGKDISDEYFIKRQKKNIKWGYHLFDIEKQNEINQKISDTLKYKFKNNLLIPSFKNKHHTEKTKDILQIKQAKRSKVLLQNGYKINYNKNACKFIDLLNIKNNWNLQHAENGGEFECCGYYLDGYDKKLNIAFEYDEPKHYIENNKLCEKDIHRQNIIINKLHCKFYRYNEKLNLLYCVN